MSDLIQTLPPGPLDIIGDIHGEIDALRRLLARLGCDPDRGRCERPLVFLGDLIDRGPNSPAVVSLVRHLVEAGLASCVVGNHELNILVDDRKQGNGWYFRDPTDFYPLKDQAGGPARLEPFPSVIATPAQVDETLSFLKTLPLALERPDLRVVHSCWDNVALAALPTVAEIGPACNAIERDIRRQLAESGVAARADAQQAQWAGLRDLDVKPEGLLEAAATEDHDLQNNNPYRVLTSGREHRITADEVFFIGGRWRFVARTRWWEDYEDDAAVVVGHYWRRRGPPHVDDIWNTPSPWDWAGRRGNVTCIDYSVGKRFLHRLEGRRDSFDGGLAALRWPERELVFDDREDTVQTTGWSG